MARVNSNDFTFWKGERVCAMTARRAREARKEVVAWANDYARVTGSEELGQKAKEFIKTFDNARKAT